MNDAPFYTGLRTLYIRHLELSNHLDLIGTILFDDIY